MVKAVEGEEFVRGKAAGGGKGEAGAGGEGGKGQG
jgi:hypothetical protein